MTLPALTIVTGPRMFVFPTSPVNVSAPPPVMLNEAPSIPADVALRVDPKVTEAVLMKVGVDVSNVTG